MEENDLMKKISSCWIVLGLILLNGCASTRIVDKNHRSLHFEKTLRHLDLGGDFFLYSDVDGDLEKLAGVFDDVLKQISVAEPDLDLSKIHLAKLFKIVGLDHIKAVGLSSYKTEDGYRNNAFILDDGERTGLMKFLNGEPGALDIPTWAPQNSDLVVERDLNLKTSFDVVMKIIKNIDEAEERQIRSLLDTSLPGMGVTYGKLIEKLDTKIYQIVRINDKMLKPPMGSIEIPFVEFAVGIDGMGFLFDDLVESFGGNPMVSVQKDKNWQIMEVKQSLPGDLGVYKPLVAKDVSTGRVFVATNRSFLDEFKQAKDTLVNSGDFKRAMRTLPTRGNGLVYSSSRLTSKITKFLEKLTKQFPEVGFSLQFIRAILPDEGVPVAVISSSLPDGILIESNTTSSHKSTILAAAYMNPALIGVMAAIAIPTFIQYIRKSKMAEVESQLQGCFMAGVEYYNKANGLEHTLGRICPDGIKTPEGLGGDGGLLQYGDAMGDYEKLGWVNRYKSYACYQYERLANSKDAKDGQPIFTCHAWTDLDGDGVVAHHYIRAIWTKGSESFTPTQIQHDGDQW